LNKVALFGSSEDTRQVEFVAIVNIKLHNDMIYRKGFVLFCSFKDTCAKTFSQIENEFFTLKIKQI